MLTVFVLLSLPCHLLQPCTPGSYSTGRCCHEGRVNNSSMLGCLTDTSAWLTDTSGGALFNKARNNLLGCAALQVARTISVCLAVQTPCHRQLLQAQTSASAG